MQSSGMRHLARGSLLAVIGVAGEFAMAQWLQAHAGLSASSASTVGTAVAVVGITYLSIVIGELVPKRLGLAKSRFILCCTDLNAEQAQGLSAMYDLSFVPLPMLKRHLHSMI